MGEQNLGQASNKLTAQESQTGQLSTSSGGIRSAGPDNLQFFVSGENVPATQEPNTLATPAPVTEDERSIETDIPVVEGQSSQSEQSPPEIEAELVLEPEELVPALQEALANPNKVSRQDVEKLVTDIEHHYQDFDDLQQKNPELAELITQLTNQRQTRQESAWQGMTSEQTLQPSSPEESLMLVHEFLDAGGDGSQLSELVETNPQLNEALAETQQAQTALALLSAGESSQAPEQLIQNVQTGADGQLEITVTDRNNQETTLGFKEYALIGVFLLIDLSTGGYNTSRILETIGRELATRGTKKYMEKLGFDVSKIGKDENFLNKRLLDTMNTRQLVNLMEGFRDNSEEMYNFLEGMESEDVTNMLAGKRFGGVFGRHQLNNQRDIDMILGKLSETQRRELEVKGVAFPKPQPDQQ